MRLFVAVAPTDAARRALVDVQRRVADELGRDADGIRWVRPEHLHVTLVFLGEVADAHVPAIVDACSRAVSSPPFDVVFAGPGVFPSRGAPRALWIGVESEAEALVALHREMAGRVARVGAAIAAGAFHPHVTLGRWRRSRSSDRGRAIDLLPRGAVARQTVNRVTLFRSVLPLVQHAGPTYAALAHANLTPM